MLSRTREFMVNNVRYSKMNLFIRSSIFSVYSLLTIGLYSLLCVMSFPLPIRWRHAVIRAYLKSYMVALRIICHIDYKVEGLENLPADNRGVVMSKHQSTWETFFLPTIFHAPAVIVKRELLWLPFFGWGLAAGSPISIDRSNASSAMKQIIEKGKACLDDGRWVLVFPEGTRVSPGEVGKYRLGGARLAVATGYPVIPVALNAGRFWPRRKFIKRPGTVRVVIGPPIESKGRTADEVLQLTRDWIESTMSRIDS